MSAPVLDRHDATCSAEQPQSHHSTRQHWLHLVFKELAPATSTTSNLSPAFDLFDLVQGEAITSNVESRACTQFATKIHVPIIVIDEETSVEL